MISWFPELVFIVTFQVVCLFRWETSPNMSESCLNVAGVMWHYSWGDVNRHLPTPDRDPGQAKVGILLKSNVVNQWVFLRLLTCVWWGLTYKRKNGAQTAASPKARPGMGTAHDPGVRCLPACRQVKRLESVRQLSWLKLRQFRCLCPPAVSSTSLCFF